MPEPTLVTKTSSPFSGSVSLCRTVHSVHATIQRTAKCMVDSTLQERTRWAASWRNIHPWPWEKRKRGGFLFHPIETLFWGVVQPDPIHSFCSLRLVSKRSVGQQSHRPSRVTPDPPHGCPSLHAALFLRPHPSLLPIIIVILLLLLLLLLLFLSPSHRPFALPPIQSLIHLTKTQHLSCPTSPKESGKP